MYPFSVPRRPVREDLAALWRGAHGEEEDVHQDEEPEPGVQRVFHLRDPLGEDPRGVARGVGHGLRQGGAQRDDRARHPGRPLRAYGDAALERHGVQTPATGRAVAPAQGLMTSLINLCIFGSVWILETGLTVESIQGLIISWKCVFIT